MTTDKERISIGRTTSTFMVASTVDEFYFWIKDGTEIQPYDFVTAVEGDFHSVGSVIEISNYTDAQSHLSNRIVSEVPGVPILERLSATIAKVNIFYSFIKDGESVIERRYPISSGVDVFISTVKEVLDGLNAGLPSTASFPGGVISRTQGDRIIVPLQADYLVGPESGHMNVSGISGLATKTSYMMFLLYVINRIKPKKYINIVFNVKSADLMNIDLPNEDLDDNDVSIYKDLFNEDSIGPFSDVIYYQPRGEAGRLLSYSTRKGQIYAFSLSDVYEDLDLLFSDVRDEYHTAEAFTRYISRDWSEDNNRWELSGTYKKYSKDYIVDVTAATWRELRKVLDEDSDGVSQLYGLAQSTISRIKRELNRLTNSSIFVDSRSKNEYFIRDVVRKANPGQTIVIDIAKLGRVEQTFVVGEVFKELGYIINLEDEANFRQAIVVVDELNTLAPKYQDSPLKEQIIEIARKGRSVGYIIFGAEQFASEVDDQIVGNSALRVMGRTSAMEIAGSAFRNLSVQEKNTLMMLRKGEMLLSFPTFRANVKVNFPRPPYKTNKSNSGQK